MQPFQAPRSRGAKTGSVQQACESEARAVKAKASPPKTDTTQHDIEDSKGPTELRVARRVIKETEEGDIDNTDNNSETKTDREDVGGNGAHWTIEARIKRAEVEIQKAE